MGLFSSVGKALFGDPTKGIKKGMKQNLAELQKGIDYTKGIQQPVLDARNMGLSGLQQYYDPSNPQGQQQFVDQAMSSPFYQSMLGQGEEAIMRNQAATGGLRTGNTQQALAQNSQNVLQGLVNQQLGGLGQFANMNVDPSLVANMYANRGGVQAQGQTAIANANQQLGGQVLGGLMGAGNMAASMGWSPFSSGGAPAPTTAPAPGMSGLTQGMMPMGAAGIFSDKTLKKDIVKTGSVNGFNTYKWTWNDLASKLGLTGESSGVIAQEVQKTRPDLIGTRDGYLTVNYGGIYG